MPEASGFLRVAHSPEGLHLGVGSRSSCVGKWFVQIRRGRLPAWSDQVRKDRFHERLEDMNSVLGFHYRTVSLFGQRFTSDDTRAVARSAHCTMEKCGDLQLKSNSSD